MSDAAVTYYSRFLLAAADAGDIPRDVLSRRVRHVVRRLTTRVDPTLTLEIGAFEADFSIWVRKTFPDARALAFEANPYVYEHFSERATGAGVEYVNACVGPENGPVTIKVPRDFRGGPRDQVNQMASLVSNLNTEHHEEVDVPGIRLDDEIDLGPDDRVVAWIDVEGALEMVLGGSEKTLSRASLAWVEVENEPMWEGQWLDTDVVRWFGEIGLVPILRDFQRHTQYNILFVSEELAMAPRVAKLAASVYKPVGNEQETPDPRVPASRIGRIQGLAQRTLKGQNEQLRRQNRRMRRINQRLRNRLAATDVEE